MFVTGYSQGATSGSDYATVAYDPGTGTQLWVNRYNGPANSSDEASAVAISPDGNTVFVTGKSEGTGASSGYDYATIAYNAATGARLWARRYNGPANNYDAASSVTVSPTGATVFVTGASLGTATGEDYATVAYNAATGAQLWVKRYNGAANGNDVASSVAVSRTGAAVFVTGFSEGVTSLEDYTTVAYDAATGPRLWARRYNGAANLDDAASSMVVSPNGTAVFVTGYSKGPTATSYADYATIAYSAATGTKLWASRYSGSANSWDQATSLAVSPGGDTVYVTGYSRDSSSGFDYATLAYNAATGAQLWASRYNGPGNSDDEALSIAVSPGGDTVYATGYSQGGSSGFDYATLAYNAATGAQLWASRYNGYGTLNDDAYSVAVSPSTGTVFVTGPSAGNGSGVDYATIAYNG